MLSDYYAFTDIAVKNIETARHFYTDTLGLIEVKRDERGDTFYKCGNGYFKIYQSTTAGTNRSTYMSWDVDDIEEMVEELKNRGVSFEYYDMPGVTREGEIHNLGADKVAWFKDPDGNILCIGKAGS